MFSTICSYLRLTLTHQIPSSKRAITIEADKIGNVTAPKTTPLTHEAKVNDPFTNDKDAIPKIPTIFEMGLHRVSKTTSVDGGRPVIEGASLPHKEKSSSLMQQTSSESPLHASDFSSPSNMTLKPTLGTQVTNSPELLALPTRETMRHIAQPQALISTKASSKASSSTTTDGTKSVFNAEAEEPVKLEVFCFNLIPRTSGGVRKSRSSSNLNVTPGHTKLTNFAAEFGTIESSTRPFVFALPAGAKSSAVKTESPLGGVVRNSRSSSSLNVTPVPTKLTNFAAEFGSTENSVRPFGFELSAKAIPSTASVGSSLGGGDKIAESQTSCEFGSGNTVLHPGVGVLSTLLHPPQSLGTWKQEPLLASNPFTLEVPNPPTSTNTKSQETISPVDSTPASEEPIPKLSPNTAGQESTKFSYPPTTPSPLPLLSTNSSNQETPPILIHPTTSETDNPPTSPDLSDQRPLPSFNFGFIPQSPNPRPRSKGSPLTKAASPAKLEENFSGFEFGTEYKVPPKSFDFATWSKVSYAARLPDKIFIRDGLTIKYEGRSEEMTMDEKVDERKAEHSQKELEDEKSEREPSIETASTTFAVAPRTQHEESETTSQSPITPIKVPQACEKYGLLTPESTPEPANMSPHTKEDTANPKGIDDPVKAQEQDLPTIVQEGSNIIAETTPKRDLALISSEDFFGHAIITPSERRYKTPLSAKHSNTLLTPPASPEAFQSSKHLDTCPPNEQRRSSTVIPRKPVPIKQQAESANHGTAVCRMCGQNTGAGGEECHCEDQEHIEWENPQPGAKTRGFTQKLKKGTVKVVKGVKTMVTEAADSIVARLEPDGAD